MLHSMLATPTAVAHNMRSYERVSSMAMGATGKAKIRHTRNCYGLTRNAASTKLIGYSQELL